MKRCCYLLLALVLILSCWPTGAWAAEQEAAKPEGNAVIVSQETISQPDGTTLEIYTVVYPTRSGNYLDGSRYYRGRNSSGDVLWTATLNARFYYNGSMSSCVSASLNIQIYESSYYEVSRSVTKEDETATANFTIGRRVLGITVSQIPFTLTLSCDMNGNLY